MGEPLGTVTNLDANKSRWCLICVPGFAYVQEPAPTVYSQIGKMRGPLAGQSGAQRPPELHMGWKTIYLLGLKQKQTPREAGEWLFLSTVRSSLLIIK